MHQDPLEILDRLIESRTRNIRRGDPDAKQKYFLLHAEVTGWISALLISHSITQQQVTDVLSKLMTFLRTEDPLELGLSPDDPEGSESSPLVFRRDESVPSQSEERTARPERPNVFRFVTAIGRFITPAVCLVVLETWSDSTVLHYTWIKESGAVHEAFAQRFRWLMEDDIGTSYQSGSEGGGGSDGRVFGTIRFDRVPDDATEMRITLREVGVKAPHQLVVNLRNN